MKNGFESLESEFKRWLAGKPALSRSLAWLSRHVPVWPFKTRTQQVVVVLLLLYLCLLIYAGYAYRVNNWSMDHWWLYGTD